MWHGWWVNEDFFILVIYIYLCWQSKNTYNIDGRDCNYCPAGRKCVITWCELLLIFLKFCSSVYIYSEIWISFRYRGVKYGSFLSVCCFDFLHWWKMTQAEFVQYDHILHRYSLRVSKSFLLFFLFSQVCIRVIVQHVNTVLLEVTQLTWTMKMNAISALETATLVKKVFISTFNDFIRILIYPWSLGFYKKLINH